MSELIRPLLESLNTHPQWAGLITFIISASESVAIIGTIIPGSITMTAIGALAGAGIIPLWWTIFWAILGAIVGDGISYGIGHYFKERLPTLWPFRTHPAVLQTGEVFFHKYGGMSVFIGRFVGPIRALVPLVAGMLGMRPVIFFIANILSAIGWAPTYMLPGMLLGAAALELPPDIALHVVLTLLFSLLLVLLGLWFIYALLQEMHSKIERCKDWLWLQLSQSRYFTLITRCLKHHDPHQTHGQLSLALYVLMLGMIWGGTLFYVKWIGSPNHLIINDAIFHLFRGMHHPTIDNLMLNLTLLGETTVIIPAALVFLGGLLIKRRYWTAGHVFLLGLLTLTSTTYLKHLLHIPRPWGLAHPLQGFAMPSGHTTLATAVYMGWCVLIATALPVKNKKWIYYMGALFVGMIGLSRLYLTAHWFTDVFTGWLWGTFLLLSIIISFRHRKEPPLSFFFIVMMGLIPLCVSFAIYHHRQFNSLQQIYVKIPAPFTGINEHTWWETGRVIPVDHTSLFGFPSQVINIEWMGHMADIKRTLQQAGWQIPPQRDLASMLHRLADVSSTRYLPMISPQYLDEKPLLVLTRYVPSTTSSKVLFVMRLWDSHCFTTHRAHILWVGTVGRIPSTYSWLFFYRQTASFDLKQVLFDTFKTRLWQWKIQNIQRHTKKHKLTYRKVIFITSSGASDAPSHT